jgi:transcriptional regulator with XRE-family HTH domain
MAKRRYSTRDKIVALSQRFTQAQIARKLRVSERTIRRWKNEGVEPSKTKTASVAKLQSQFERERKRVAQSLERDRAKHRGAPRLEKRVAVLPIPERRAIRQYRGGKWTGKYRESDWLNYDVSRLSFAEVHALVVALRDQGRVVQLIYRIPKGGRYPRDERGRPGRVVDKATKVGTPITDLSNLDDGDIQDFMLRFVHPEPSAKGNRFLIVAALDKGRVKKRRRSK